MVSDFNQIDRIKSKLLKARELDGNFEVFGASSHKYFVNKPAKIDEVKSLENTFSIQLPECYKSFILQVGNGGHGHSNAAAGPDYGIFPLGKNVDEFLYENIEEGFGNACLLKPKLSDDEWAKITIRIDDDAITDEEFVIELGRIYGGILPVGSQGCTYRYGLVLNGDYKGRIVNIDIDRQKPVFALENNFLDWYESWLDKVISGNSK